MTAFREVAGEGLVREAKAGC